MEALHLDEYIGIPVTHLGSLRKMLMEQLISKTGIVKYHLLDGDGDVASAVQRESAELASAPIDIAFLGIGENGHLAFNDPPANFTQKNHGRKWPRSPATALTSRLLRLKSR